ncbi:hypothetical protein E2C01_021558 [Portunus trituberculatus]|uniref:Uncharacterized protein n=1 Tax=Portunus trituberculatus TaxID=210409 RepID=A0A5B7E596_PORTR|nr:hypothetical protein [Portunus trituberculatus]
MEREGKRKRGRRREEYKEEFTVGVSLHCNCPSRIYTVSPTPVKQDSRDNTIPHNLHTPMLSIASHQFPRISACRLSGLKQNEFSVCAM